MSLELMHIILLIVGLAIGVLSGILFTRNKLSGQSEAHQREIDQLKEEYQKILTELSVVKSEKSNLKENFENKVQEVKAFQSEKESIQQNLVRAEAENKNLLSRMEEHKAEVEQLRKQFIMEFENISSKLLKTNAKEFAETNQKRIDEILNPFKEKIEKFEKTVQETHHSNLKEQTTLRSELKNLHELNQRMAEEAKNLTLALKGDSKQQGNWGEILLEKVLERSGLQKGIEYEREVVIDSDDNKKLRPDAIVYLPEKKHIIIDSKVSLVAYEKSVEADTEEKRNEHLKAHLASVRSHIKNLSSKNYYLSNQLDTPEFVLMFMPIEPAFSAVVQFDKEIFNEAWDNRIVMVSPSTLLATLRTVASLWKHEKQTENALKIAREGGKLYDRIALFLQEFERLERPLDQAKESYIYLRDKLVTNRQSLSRTASRLKELGAKTSKKLPEHYLLENEEDEQ